MSGLVKALIALLALAVLGWFCIYHEAPAIEADVLARSQAELGGSLSAANITVDGRDLTLTGELASQVEVDGLVRRASRIVGVRSVSNQLSVAPPVVVEPYVTVITRSSDGLTLSGELPDLAYRERLRAALSEFGQPLQLADSSELKEQPPNGWERALRNGIDALSRLDSGKITVSDNQLQVEGVVPSEAIRAGIDSTLASAGVPVEVRIDVVAPPPAQQVLNCQAMFNDALAGEKILFATGSARISSDSMALLDRLTRIARRCPDVRIEVAGHTDSRGDSALNQRLSEQRAGAVADALAARGIASDRIEAQGYGESRPRAVNATAAGREENRRIELTVTAR